jgi:hypothetical protein
MSARPCELKCTQHATCPTTVEPSFQVVVRGTTLCVPVGGFDSRLGHRHDGCVHPRGCYRLAPMGDQRLSAAVAVGLAEVVAVGVATAPASAMGVSGRSGARHGGV